MISKRRPVSSLRDVGALSAEALPPVKNPSFNELRLRFLARGGITAVLTFLNFDFGGRLSTMPECLECAFC
jgi:hypothetical protein